MRAIINWDIFIIAVQICSSAAIAAFQDILVDEISGIDTEDCLAQYDKTRACQSVSYAYHKGVEKNLEAINIRIIGVYHLKSTLRVDIPSSFVKNLRIHGDSNSSIVGATAEASIVVGSKNDPQGLPYSVAFTKLTFSGFYFHNTAVVTCWSKTVLTIQDCTFVDNKCAAINAYDAVINIEDSLFYRNLGSAIGRNETHHDSPPSFPEGSSSAGGAVAVVFSKVSSKSVLVRRNRFVNNTAVTLTRKYVGEKRNGDLEFTQVGGGLLLAFINVSSHNHVFVHDNIFESNSGAMGGAMMLSFHNYAKNNNVTIKSTILSRNIATRTGGGIAVMAWGRSSDNTISIAHSQINDNQAAVGGGGKVLLQSIWPNSSSKLVLARQFIYFCNVSFARNTAASASGLHMIYNMALREKPPVPVYFKDVSFTHHVTRFHSHLCEGPSAYAGVLLSNRIDLKFEGLSIFSNNTVESSLYLSNSDLHLHGSLLISDNRVQTLGGGMTVSDVSHLHLYSGSDIIFKNNYAELQGGAIFVRSMGFPDLVYKYNPSCFIQYEECSNVPPSKWNATISFIRNGAGLKGGAIFANTLSPCAWSEHAPHYDVQEALRWKGVFVYEENYLSGKRSSYRSSAADIATDTIKYKMKDAKQVYEVSPGEELKFDMDAFDELHNSVYSVPVAQLYRKQQINSNRSGIELNQLYYIVRPHTENNMSLRYHVSPDYYRKLYKNAPAQETVRFVDSFSSFPSDANISIKVVPCYPGFIYENGECVCDKNNENVIRCEGNLVYIKKDHWAMTTPDGKLLIKPCPHRYCKCNSNVTQIGCAFNFQNPDLQCSTNRGGVLCGKCLNGTRLSLVTSQCQRCEEYHWTIIGFIVLGTAVLLACVLVITINPQLSAFIKGIVFYLQILPYVCGHLGEINTTVQRIAAWVDFGGVNNIPINTCFVENFNNLLALSLGYIYPLIILLVLLIMYFLHRFHLVNLKRNSPFQSFCILIVVMYKFLVETSLLILFCVNIGDQSVFFYDGNIRCYTHVHLALTIVAVVVLLTLVLPPPILVPLIVSGVVPCGPFVGDALAQGLRQHVRWWWSFDFIRRICFISVFVFVPDWRLRQTCLAICSILTLVLHIQKQPYCNRKANIGETYLLLTLTLVTVLPLPDNQDNKILYNIIATILSLSVVYIFIVFLYLSSMFLKKRCRARDDAKHSGEDRSDVYSERSISQRQSQSQCSYDDETDDNENVCCCSIRSHVKERASSSVGRLNPAGEGGGGRMTRGISSTSTSVLITPPPYTRSDYYDSAED